MYRLSDFDFGVYFKREVLPSREQWQSAVDTKKLPLLFSDDFDPHNHPICEPTQAGHPDGEVVVTIGGVAGRYLIDRHHGTDSAPSWLETEGCDTSFAFRWDYENGVDCLAAYLSAATLALATNGEIIWTVSSVKSRIGAEAYKYLTRQGWDRTKSRIRKEGLKLSKQDPFGPPLEPLPQKDEERRELGLDWECPRCGWPFSLKNCETYDGEKHTPCGQLIATPTL